MRKTFAYIVVILMMLAFIAFGVWGTVQNALCLHGYWRTRDLCTVPAKLTALERHQGHGNQGATAAARYTYEVAGHTYTGSQISLLRKSEDVFPDLDSAFRVARPISVYIDPRRPGFSVIDREWGGWILVSIPFCLTFLVVGLMLLWSFWRSWQAGRPLLEFPEPPAY